MLNRGGVLGGIDSSGLQMTSIRFNQRHKLTSTRYQISSLGVWTKYLIQLNRAYELIAKSDGIRGSNYTLR